MAESALEEMRRDGVRCPLKLPADATILFRAHSEVVNCDTYVLKVAAAIEALMETLRMGIYIGLYGNVRWDRGRGWVRRRLRLSKT